MTQGNPFGNKGGRWMPESKLRALFRAGRSYDEVAEANFRAEGWRPTRSAVLRKYQTMGMPPRHASHTELLPWNVRPEHSDHLFRHMLQAESRRRQKRALSETDKKLIARLNDLLFGRGTPMVIDYHPETGFSLALAEEGEDIIRQPTSPEKLRKEVRAQLREQVTEEYDEETAQRVLRAIEGQTSEDAKGDRRERA